MIAIWRSKVSRGAEPVHRISCFEVLFRTFRGQTSNRWSRIIVGICNHPTLDFSIFIFWLATVNTKSIKSIENMFHLIVTKFEVCSMKWSLFYSSSHSIEDESHTGKKTVWVGILWTVVFLHEVYCCWARACKAFLFFIAICLQMFLHEVIQLDGLSRPLYRFNSVT